MEEGVWKIAFSRRDFHRNAVIRRGKKWQRRWDGTILEFVLQFLFCYEKECAGKIEAACSFSFAL